MRRWALFSYGLEFPIAEVAADEFGDQDDDQNGDDAEDDEIFIPVLVGYPGAHDAVFDPTVGDATADGEDADSTND